MQNMSDMLQELEALRAENQQLPQLLEAHGIAIPDTAEKEDVAIPEIPTAVTKRSPLADKITLFMFLFYGRPDVYARRWESKDGRAGYSPVCVNEWKPGICLKPKGRCADCRQADYAVYGIDAVAAHLSGRCVLGIYPLLQDETCPFLSIDFDEENWRADVQMVAQTCRSNGIPCSVEISRSGNGAHLWIFFSESVNAAKARALGSAILTLAMKEHAGLSFKSYDRMFPNQDTMPRGGFGNLIALPLQVSASRHGGSLFVDEQLQPYSDQWVYLSSVQRMSSAQVDDALARLRTSPLGELLPDDDAPVQPWHRRVGDLRDGDVPTAVSVTLADGLYIPIAGFSSRAQNQLKRLAAFRNPQFYRSQATRMPVWNIPRVICCAEYQEGYLRLPRGCMDDLDRWMQENHVNVTYQNECTPGRSIDVIFNGVLRGEQSAALQALSAYDNGILSAMTAFGKTVIGAALIAKKKVNTLVLVHRAQLMEQWQERL